MMGTANEYEVRAAQDSLRYTSFQPEAAQKIEPWWDMEAVAAYVGQCADTIKKHIDDGSLRAYRVGSGPSLRFKKSDVDALFTLVPPNGNGSKKNGAK
jgi:excisionase family DNA binding protein